MSGRADRLLESLLLERLQRGPADLLDLVGAARAGLGRVLEGHEGAVHALLHRLVRGGAVRVDGTSDRGLALYLGVAHLGVGRADPGGERWQPRAPDAEPVAVEAARSIRDAEARRRVAADLSAHLLALRAIGREAALGRASQLRGLLRRADRGHPAVFLPGGPGGHLLRLVLHEGPWVLAAVLLYLLLITFVVKLFVIPSASMLPTLQHGDRVLVRVAGDDWRPERWRIVTYMRPGQDGPRTTYVKRAVGLPGEAISLWHGDVYIDDRLVAKPESMNEVVRARVRAWAFEAATPPEGWVRANGEGGVDVWGWQGERFWARPDGDARRFEVQDVYLELDVDLGQEGGAELLLSRGRDPLTARQFALSVHPRAGIRVEIRVPGGVTFLTSVEQTLRGRTTLRLALVDGVLRAQAGEVSWSGPVEVPAEPAAFGFATSGPARPLALRLDKDLHYGVEGAMAVPQDARAQDHTAGVHRVGEQAIFCLGDNTDDSRDSRFQDVGDIPLSQLVGPVVWRIWPPGRFGGVR